MRATIFVSLLLGAALIAQEPREVSCRDANPEALAKAVEAAFPVQVLIDDSISPKSRFNFSLTAKTADEVLGLALKDQKLLYKRLKVDLKEGERLKKEEALELLGSLEKISRLKVRVEDPAHTERLAFDYAKPTAEAESENLATVYFLYDPAKRSKFERKASKVDLLLDSQKELLGVWGQLSEAEQEEFMRKSVAMFLNLDSQSMGNYMMQGMRMFLRMDKAQMQLLQSRMMDFYKSVPADLKKQLEQAGGMWGGFGGGGGKPGGG
jgi:hypothetical protein